MTARDESVVLAAGQCRICSCTETSACELDSGTCWWVDRGHTLCSNPECLAQLPVGSLESICQLKAVL
jgi:hypothetical protein